MGIKPICDICNKEINRFGGLYFAATIPPEHKHTVKYHVCVACEKESILPLMKTGEKNVFCRRINGHRTNFPECYNKYDHECYNCTHGN